MEIFLVNLWTKRVEEIPKALKLRKTNFSYSMYSCYTKHIIICTEVTFPLRATHETVIFVLKRAHHTAHVVGLPLVFFFFLWGSTNSVGSTVRFCHRAFLHFGFIDWELNSVSCWFCPKVVHARFQPLKSNKKLLTLQNFNKPLICGFILEWIKNCLSPPLWRYPYTMDIKRTMF